ncbi:MAG: hypothetical protein GY953_56400, partial [bacterium]|nr:hypothetical protein [bacterium]
VGDDGGHLPGVVTAGTGEAGTASKFIMQETDPIPDVWFDGKGVYPTEFVGASYTQLWSGTLIYESSASNTVFQGDIVEVAGRGNEYFGLSQVLPHNGSASAAPGSADRQSPASDLSGTILQELDGNRLRHVRWSALSAGAPDETAPCTSEFRNRLSKHKSRGAQKQDGDGDTHNDIRPE